jgi:hypothetical protein
MSAVDVSPGMAFSSDRGVFLSAESAHIHAVRCAFPPLDTLYSNRIAHLRMHARSQWHAA